MEWLTIGLVVFSGVQLILQSRQERLRKLERRADAEELADRAYHYAWAEHFRLWGLAERMRREDLIESAVLGVLKPSDVLPYDWGELTRSLASLGREAGFLGGVAASLCHDVEKAIGIFVGSISAFLRQAPPEMTDPQKVIWLRENFGPRLEPWEESMRTQVEELASLTWDALCQSTPGSMERELDFSDNLTSRFARTAVESLAKRAAEDPVELRPPREAGHVENHP